MIKKWRKEKGYTQQDMAKLLDVSYDSYVSYENGRCKIPWEVLIKFLKLRNTTQDKKIVKILEELEKERYITNKMGE